MKIIFSRYRLNYKSAKKISVLNLFKYNTEHLQRDVYPDVC